MMTFSSRVYQFFVLFLCNVSFWDVLKILWYIQVHMNFKYLYYYYYIVHSIPLFHALNYASTLENSHERVVCTIYSLFFFKWHIFQCLQILHYPWSIPEKNVYIVAGITKNEPLK